MKVECVTTNWSRVANEMDSPGQALILMVLKAECGSQMLSLELQRLDFEHSMPLVGGCLK